MKNTPDTSPQIEPTNTTPPEMEVTGVEIKEYKSGIPLQGWDKVKSALNEFSGGHSKNARATERHNVSAYSQMDPLAGITFLRRNNLVGGNTFVDEMLQEAEPQIKERGRWRRSYDYDGQGSFHKTTVEIRSLDEIEDGYLLGLNAAYVGKDVEDGLAEHLGTEQGLQWKSVNVQFQPEGDKFKVDFNTVLRKMRKVRHELKQPSKSVLSEVLQTLRGHQVTEGEQLAQHFMTTDRFGSEPKPVVLGTTSNGLEVTLGFGRVGGRFDYENGQRSESKWDREGAIVETPLAKSYEDKSKSVAPSLVISVQRAGADSYDRLPIIDPEAKATADKLAQEITAAFQK